MDVRYLLLLCLAATTVSAQDFKEKAPGPKSKGRPFLWKTNRGFEYVYRVPKSYKPKKRATLLIIFHDKGHRSAFDIRNYPRYFRPDDILLYPGRPTDLDGGGSVGSIEYKPEPLDARVIRGIYFDFLKAFKVQATLLYGVGNGASFALYYAGSYPQEVDGVVAETGTVWKDTEITKAQEDMPVMLMQFLADERTGLASYAKGLELFRSKGVTQLRHSVVFARGSPASHPSAVELGLAWCETMSTANPDRLKAAYKSVTRIRDRRLYDYGALYQICKKMAIKRNVGRIEKLAAGHVAAIRAALGDNKDFKFDGKPWAGHYFAFRRGFAGVPACDALVAEWKEHIDKHAAAAKDQRLTWTDQRGKNPQAAFWSCAEIIRGACLDPSPLANPMASDMAKWKQDAGKHVLDKKDLAAYEAFLLACEQGAAAYDEINKKWRP